MGSPEKNIWKYGQTIPPDYDIKSIKVPFVIISGSKDPEADPQDVQWLLEQLGENVVFHGEYELTHNSFLIAKDMTWFTNDVMNQLKKLVPPQ